MKFVRFLLFMTVFIPCVSFGAASSDFQRSAKLLAAARRGDIQTVQFLINSGADVNYVDSTGVSIVCTAVMNNDARAIQILQMYGADASNCDRQIKNYKRKTRVATSGEDYSFFSGLSSSHVLVLSAVGVAAVLGGVALLTDVFDSNNGGGSGTSSDTSHGGGSGGGGGTSGSTTTLLPLNLPYGPGCTGDDCSTDYAFWQNRQDFEYMSENGFNYLMVAHAYDAFVRGYLGMSTVRISNDKSPFDLTQLPFVQPESGDAEPIGGGKPVNVAMVTKTGVNAVGSAIDGLIPWIDVSQIAIVKSICNASGIDSTACQNAMAAATNVSHKYYNYSSDEDGNVVENTVFNLTGSGSVFGGASDDDTELAKIIAGWEHGGRGVPDYFGFIPNGQLLVYKTGVGESGVSDYKNYYAINNALTLKSGGTHVADVVVNLSLPDASVGLDYVTVAGAKSLNDAATTTAMKKSTYRGLINNYYNLNTDDDDTVDTPGDDAESAFNYLGNQQLHILINSAGRNKYGFGTGESLDAQYATFENFAPGVYNDLENLFMTVVALSPKNGTEDTTISAYNPTSAGKLQLSQWGVSDGDDNITTYSSRICGLTGTGNGGTLNPWCFAAPGATDMEATASMAGAVALVKSAFNYMSADQVFLLLALTADGPYLGTNPETGLSWTSQDVLISYLQNMYILPGSLDTSTSQYLETFKTAFGYGVINLERATRPNTNAYFFDANKQKIVTTGGTAYWRSASAGGVRASNVLSLTGRGAIKTSFYDVLQSADGTVSLPRVWNGILDTNASSRHGLYMGDVLGEFDIGGNYKNSERVGDFEFSVAMSPRAYVDNYNGLDNLHVGFVGEDFDISAEYQRHLTDGETRFGGRANGLLALVANAVVTDADYKFGNFAFGARAFSGTITDESLLDTDPVVSSQYEPGRLGLTSGVAVDAKYNNDKFDFDLSVGVMNETNTVLGMYSDGLFNMRGGKTQYLDAVAIYKPIDNVKLSVRGMFADTTVDEFGGMISGVSDIKSNAFAVGLDVGGFGLTVAAPLAVVDGRMSYGYADFTVVENDGQYDVAMNNPHTEYVDLAAQKRELRFSSSYKKSFDEHTLGGVEFMYRVNPGHTDVFGNESLLMFKIHHKIGI